MWDLITDPQNREVLGWLGGGLVVIIGAVWAAYTYFDQRGRQAGGPSVKADRGVAAGRDLHHNTITISGRDEREG